MNDIKNNDIPKHLKSTYRMLVEAFPEGIDEDMYSPLLALLHEEMSDRNLAEVFSRFSGKDYSAVINDIYKSVTVNKPTKSDLSKAKERLVPFGYKKWLSEE